MTRFSKAAQRQASNFLRTKYTTSRLADTALTQTCDPYATNHHLLFPALQHPGAYRVQRQLYLKLLQVNGHRVIRTPLSEIRQCPLCLARIRNEGSHSPVPVETQAHCMGGCPSLRPLYWRRHEAGLQARVKQLTKDMSPGRNIQIIVDKTLSSTFPDSILSGDTGKLLRPDILWIDHDNKTVVVEEHTYVSDPTLAARVDFKKEKYADLVSHIASSLPGIAGYNVSFTVFAIGHCGTVPPSTMHACQAIPSPPESLAALRRNIASSVRYYNHAIAHRRFSNIF